MSIVAWDGKTLAADRQATNADLAFTTTKLWAKNGQALAITGTLDSGLEMLDWYLSGASKESFPTTQQKGEDWARLIVADALGCRFYEQSHHPQFVLDPFMAWGCARDFAIGAMAKGANAVEAVEIASRFSTGCGLGIDSFTPESA